MTDASLGNLLRTLVAASDWHRRQRRKDADRTPYINHPIQVADLLARIAGVTDVVTAIPMFNGPLHSSGVGSIETARNS